MRFKIMSSEVIPLWIFASVLVIFCFIPVAVLVTSSLQASQTHIEDCLRRFQSGGAGEMPKQLRVHAALSEHPSLVSITHTVAHNYPELQF